MATQTFSHLRAAPRTRSLVGVCRWAWATLAVFVVVVLEGAVVRATSSGAGCGDRWPLCNGEILPHHPRIATIIEFTHRSLTGVSSAMFAVLIVWTFYATLKRHPARRAVSVAGLLLLSEAFLGAVLVLRHLVEKNTSALRVVMQSVHFTNTLLLLAATAVTAVLLSPGVMSADPARSSQPMKIWSTLAILATILTGATGSLAALADTIFPSPSLSAAIAADFARNSPLLIRMRWMHPAASALATAAVLYLAYALWRQGRKRLAVMLGINVLLQIVLGTVDVLLLAPTWIQVLHLLSADVFWITLVALSTPLLFPRAWAACALSPIRSPLTAAL